MQEVKRILMLKWIKPLLALALVILMSASGVFAGASVCLASDELEAPLGDEPAQETAAEDANGSGDEGSPNVDLVYTSQDSGNTLIVMDNEKLFSEAEIQDFMNSAAGVLKYGNVIIATAREADYEGYAKDTSINTFGRGSDTTVFLINMDPRKIYLCTDGKMKEEIPAKKALSITDNIYRQARMGAYYACAAKALKQEATLLSGGDILEPMVYIGNFFLAFAIALLCTFGLTFATLPEEKHEVIAGLDEALLAAIVSGVAFSLVNEDKIYDPIKSSSSSGGGGGFSGGGGGGPSGGGHSF